MNCKGSTVLDNILMKILKIMVYNPFPYRKQVFFDVIDEEMSRAIRNEFICYENKKWKQTV